MAKQRPIVGPISAPPALQPQAHPVSTYSDPLNGGGPDPKNGFRELATALANFTPGLAAYADRYVAEEQLRARADALTEAERNRNREGLAKAVKAGELPAGASPWYRKAWDQQDAEIRGHAYTNAIETWYAQSDVKNVEVSDPRWGQALDEFTNGYAKEQGLEAHPEYHAILGPMMGQARERLTAAHTQYRIQETERKVAEGADTLSRQVITDGIKSGEDPSVTALTLQAIANRNIQNGQSGLVANKIAAGAIINEAKNNLNLKTLDLLDEFDTGNGKLGNVGWVKDLRAAAEAEISNSLLAKAAHEHVQGERQQKEESEKLHGDFIVDRLSNPDFNLVAWQKKAAAIDPKLAASFNEFNNAFLNNTVAVQEDPAVLAGLYARINAPNNPLTSEQVMAEASARRIGLASVGNLNQAIGAAKGRSPLDDDVMKSFAAKVDTTIAGSGYGPRNPVLQQASDLAVLRFQQVFGEYLAQHKDADYLEKRKYATDLYTSLTAGYKQEGASENLPSEESLRSLAPVPESNPSAAMAAPKGSMDINATLVFADPAAFNTAIEAYNLSQGQDGTIVRIAQQHGVDPTTFIASQKALLKRQASTPKKPPK